MKYNFVWRDYEKLWEIPDFADVAAPNEHITLLLSRFPRKSVCRGVVHVPDVRERGPSINLQAKCTYMMQLGACYFTTSRTASLTRESVKQWPPDANTNLANSMTSVPWVAYYDMWLTVVMTLWKEEYIRVMHSSQFGFNLGLISKSNFDKACPNLSSWFCAKSKWA